MPGPPEFVSTATRRDRGRRAVAHRRPSPCRTALRSRGAQHAGLREQRIDRRVARRQRAGVRRRRARAGDRAPGFDDDDRLRLRDPPGDLEKLARISEVLDVHEHDVDRRVVLPIPEQVVAADVGLVADGDELRNADAVLARVVEHRQAERARLRHERGASRRRHRRARRWRSSTSRVGVQDAHAVRPDHAHAVAPARSRERRSRVDPLAADFAESRGDDDEPAHPRARRTPRPPSSTSSFGTTITASVRDVGQLQHSDRRAPNRPTTHPDSPGYTAPVNPSAIRLRRTSWPIALSRREAPTTAMDRGASRAFSTRYSSVGVSGPSSPLLTRAVAIAFEPRRPD